MLFTESMSIGEKFINSIAITILGMVVVFTVLVIIAYSLNVLKFMFSDKPKNVEEKESIKKNLDERTNIEIVETEEYEDDSDLIILLTAAIAAVSDTSSENIVVRSIKELPQRKSTWAMVGRQQQMLNRI